MSIFTYKVFIHRGLLKGVDVSWVGYLLLNNGFIIFTLPRPLPLLMVTAQQQYFAFYFKQCAMPFTFMRWVILFSRLIDERLLQHNTHYISELQLFHFDIVIWWLAPHQLAVLLWLEKMNMVYNIATHFSYPPRPRQLLLSLKADIFIYQWYHVMH